MICDLEAHCSGDPQLICCPLFGNSVGSLLAFLYVSLPDFSKNRRVMLGCYKGDGLSKVRLGLSKHRLMLIIVIPPLDFILWSMSVFVPMICLRLGRAVLYYGIDILFCCLK